MLKDTVQLNKMFHLSCNHVSTAKDPKYCIHLPQESHSTPLNIDKKRTLEKSFFVKYSPCAPYINNYHVLHVKVNMSSYDSRV